MHRPDQLLLLVFKGDPQFLQLALNLVFEPNERVLHQLFYGAQFDDHVLRTDVDCRLEVLLGAHKGGVAHDGAHQALQVVDARVDV